MRIDFFDIDKVNDNKLQYAVIAAVFKGKWIFVKHKERDTWEIPGGHRELDEDINITGKRELYEETGAKAFKIVPLFDYSVTTESAQSFGRLFFAEVEKLGELPDLEIGEVKLFDKLPDRLTYPEIQPYLYYKVCSTKR